MVQKLVLYEAIYCTWSETDIKHWNIVDLTLPMTINLYNYYSEDNIENLFCWAPGEKQWWITGFNSKFDKPDCEKMVSLGTINFAGKEEMFCKITAASGSHSRVCLKIHFRHLYAPLRGIFDPNSVSVAHYASFIGANSSTKCDVYLAKSNFQTHSSTNLFVFKWQTM